MAQAGRPPHKDNIGLPSTKTLEAISPMIYLAKPGNGLSMSSPLLIGQLLLWMGVANAGFPSESVLLLLQPRSLQMRPMLRILKEIPMWRYPLQALRGIALRYSICECGLLREGLLVPV